MKILIIKLSAFGDIIHSLSVFECFEELRRQRNMEAEVDWLIERKWAPILAGHPGVNRLIISDTKVWRKNFLKGDTWEEISAFRAELRKEKYDLVMDINGLIRSAVLARFARAHERIGFSNDSDFVRERHSSLFLDRTFYVPGGHVVDQTTGLLEKALDITMPASVIPFLPVNRVARAEAQRTVLSMGLDTGRFAVIAAGGGWATKLLKPSLVASFCDMVARYDIVPVLSCTGKDERQRAEEISDIAEGSVIIMEDIPVDIFIEIMRLSRLVTGPDTGTVHAASAVETPTVSYYGPSSGGYSGPRRVTDKVIQISPECGPCFKRRCDRCLCQDLNVDKVLNAISEQLEKTVT